MLTAAPGATTPSPFDERAVLCDNPRAVIHLRSLVALPLLAVLAAAGCEKTNDVPRMQDDAQAVAKTYQDEIDDLARRAQATGRRIGALPPEALSNSAVQHTFQEAAGILTRTRNDLRQIPVRIRAGTDPEELQKLIADLHEKIGDSVREATSDVSAIESWVAVVEQQRKAGTLPAPAPAPAATEDSAGSTAPAH